VHTIDLGGRQLNSSPHFGVELLPVKFISKKRMRIVTPTYDGPKDIEVARWKD
jgi:hypothetical protein